MFSFICVWINGWVNNREAGDLKRYRAHYAAIVMAIKYFYSLCDSLVQDWYKAYMHTNGTYHMIMAMGKTFASLFYQQSV